MRILIVAESFLPKVDGVTRTIAKLLEYLQEHGHEVVLFGPESTSTHYAGARLLGTKGIPLYQYPELSLNLWRPGFTAKLLEFQPDVIHLVDPVWLGGAALAVCKIFQRARLGAIPLVASYHTNLATYCGHFGWGVFTPLMWRWNQFCHAYCNVTVCPSPSTKQMLVQHGFKNVRIWPRGVSMTRFSPHHRSAALRHQWLKDTGKHKEKAVILYVGRVSHEKNLTLLLDTYRPLDHTECHLVIVGDGPALDTLRAQASQRRLPVTFTGYLFGHELATAFASADIFAFPSTTETFGQVVLEAMASGLPVCGLQAEGVCDLVQHGTTGFLMDPTGLSHEQQCQQYGRDWQVLIKQGDRRTAMSQQAVEAAKAYTWPNALECMVQVYKDAHQQQQLQQQQQSYGRESSSSTVSTAPVDQPTVIDMKDPAMLQKES
ncbi:glycosyl transferase group 1 [Gongronella butleri]|nr:glycosyl transferase group 1 [Gongronella butleri]